MTYGFIWCCQFLEVHPAKGLSFSLILKHVEIYSCSYILYIYIYILFIFYFFLLCLLFTKIISLLLLMLSNRLFSATLHQIVNFLPIQTLIIDYNAANDGRVVYILHNGVLLLSGCSHVSTVWTGRGLSSQPWGTQVVSTKVEEARLPIHSHWGLFVRKSSNQLQSLVLKPRVFLLDVL